MRLAAADIGVVDQLADHALEDDRRLDELDLVAGLEQLFVAAGLQRHVAIAEHAGGDDRGRGVDRQLERRIERRA